MAWLRSKKRTLDLSAMDYTDKKTAASSSSSRKCSMDEGQYKYQHSLAQNNTSGNHKNSSSNNNNNNNSNVINNTTNIVNDNQNSNSGKQKINDSSNSANSIKSSKNPSANNNLKSSNTSNINNTSNNNNNNNNNNNKLDTTKFMNGVLSTSPCTVETTDLLNEDELIQDLLSIYETESKNNASKGQNEMIDDEVFVNEKKDDILNGECLQKRQQQQQLQQLKLSEITVEDSDCSASLSPTLEHSTDENIPLDFNSFLIGGREKNHLGNEKYPHDDESLSADEDEESHDEIRDSFSEDTLRTFQNKKNFNRARHSLDSQMALLPQKLKSNLKGSSVESLEDNQNDGGDDDGDSDTPLSKPLKKKSISWASDLETIHEFEKIKGRRLSLSSLFKKF